MQQKIIKTAIEYSKQHNIKMDTDFAAIKLLEETGEFAQALLIHQKKCRTSKLVGKDISKKELGKELADVIGIAILNAYLLDINLEDAINKKWINK